MTLSDMSPLAGDVWGFVADRDDEILDFARDLIRTPSPNPPGDERAVADLVTQRLHDLGVDDVVRLGAVDTRPNLIVRVPGSRPGKTLMLSGHLDTKPAGDMEAWETDPWDPIVRDGMLIGLGSGDMKAAVAGMVYAAAALRRAGGFPGELVVVFTADEEAGSIVGSKWLAENGHLSADVAVIGEPSGITHEWQAIHLISRGAALFKVRVSGTQMHSSISDRIKGINATVEMARLIDRMDRELKDYLSYEPHPLCPTGPTVNVGVMAEAGVFYGVYPGRAEFACDLRTIPGMTEEVLRSDIQRFLDDAMADDPDLHAELVWEIMVPATEISPDEPVVAALRSAATDVLGTAPDLDAFPGATDAPHFQLTAGVPCVAAFGPGMLPRAHSPNEYMAADGAAKAAKVYALAAIRYLEEQA
jgi:acetylornithine deacetylase